MLLFTLSFLTDVINYRTTDRAFACHCNIQGNTAPPTTLHVSYSTPKATYQIVNIYQLAERYEYTQFCKTGKHMQHLPDSQLSNAEHGDASFAEFYQLHALTILAYLRLRTSSAEEAEDLLLEVFLTALEQPMLLKRNIKTQRAWLHRVARNKLVDSYRQQGRRPSVSLDVVAEHLYEDDTHSPEQVALRNEQYARLNTILGYLSPKQRQMIQLRFIYGLSCAEIALVLEKKEGTVRRMLTRTLTFVREIYTRN